MQTEYAFTIANSKGKSQNIKPNIILMYFKNISKHFNCEL